MFNPEQFGQEENTGRKPDIAASKPGLLPVDLLDAFENGDREKIARLKNLSQERFPSQVEGVEALFGAADFFDSQKNLDAIIKQNNGWTSEAMEIVEEITQYRFLICDLVKNNKGNVEFLAKFWQAIGQIAEKTGSSLPGEQLKESTLSQVAVYHAFEGIGLKPAFSTPKEDAFKAVDLWGRPDEAVQIKTSALGTAIFDDYDEVAFPGVEIENNGKICHVDSYSLLETFKFRAKAHRYAREIKKPLKSLMVFIHKNDRDPITGEPGGNVVELFRKKFNFGQKNEKSG